MCWSFEVALAFSIFEFLGIATLLYRDLFIDRYLALFQIPIATQELIQSLIWKYGNPQNSTLQSCTKVNQSLSYLWVLTILFVPLLLSWLHHNVSSTAKQHLWIIKYYTKPNLIIQSLFYWISGFLVLYVAYDRSNAKCTIVNKSGHLRMIFEGSLLGLPTAILCNFFYYYPIAMLAILLRPMWFLAIAMVGAVISATAIRISEGIAYGTLWCWSASFLVVYWLVLPYFVKFVVTKFDIDALEKNIFFDGTREYLKVYYPQLRLPLKQMEKLTEDVPPMEVATDSQV